MRPIAASVLEGNALSLMARVVDDAGAAIQQADLSSIAWKLWRLPTGTATAAALVSGPTTLTIGNVVYDTLQTGGAWTFDAIGYNFKFLLPSSAIISDTTFTETNAKDVRPFQVAVKFTCTDPDRNFYVRFELGVSNNLYERP